MLSFAVAGVVLVVLPGPDTMLMLRSIVLQGRGRAARTAAGILTGLLLWALAAALGVSALLRASHAGYLALRVVGGVYLVCLGLSALGRRRRSVAESPRGGVLGTGYVAGLTTNLLNPKVGVFFLTFLPAFIPRGAPVGATSMLLGLVYAAETAVYFGVLVVMVEQITRLLASATFRRRLETCSGVVLVGFGARLVLEG